MLAVQLTLEVAEQERTGILGRVSVVILRGARLPF